MAAHIKISDKYTKAEKTRAYEAFWREMMPYVGASVSATFEKGSHSMRNPTRPAVAERVETAKKLVDTMRQDLKWSKFRIRENLTYYLSAHLSGIALPMESHAHRNSWLTPAG